jgi:hypothetical protein
MQREAVLNAAAYATAFNHLVGYIIVCCVVLSGALYSEQEGIIDINQSRSSGQWGEEAGSSSLHWCCCSPCRTAAAKKAKIILQTPYP